MDTATNDVSQPIQTLYDDVHVVTCRYYMHSLLYLYTSCSASFIFISVQIHLMARGTLKFVSPPKILHKYIWLINCEQFKEHVYSGYHMYNVCYDIGWYIWVLYLIMNGRVYILIITEWKCSYVVKYKR